jgi:hypothetical protein
VILLKSCGSLGVRQSMWNNSSVSGTRRDIFRNVISNRIDHTGMNVLCRGR